MAKLSAHGHEIARLVYETPIRDHTYRVHLSFRSDGHVLRRLVALNLHPSGSRPSDRHADYGWKLFAKLSDPKRDTRARQVRLAHDAARKVEQDPKATILDLKAPPH